MEGLTQTRIVKVTFYGEGERTHYFGSVKAIFAMFTAEQVGRTYGYLHSYMRGAKRYETSKCVIERIPLYRMKSKPKMRGIPKE